MRNKVFFLGGKDCTSECLWKMSLTECKMGTKLHGTSTILTPLKSAEISL